MPEIIQEQMNHIFEIFFPSQCSCGKEDLPPEVWEPIYKEAREKMGRWFGGGQDRDVSEIKCEGFWYASDRDEIAYEKNCVIFSNATAYKYIQHKDDFLAYMKSLTDRLYQQSMACRIDGKMTQFVAKSPVCVSEDKIPIGVISENIIDKPDTPYQRMAIHTAISRLADTGDPQDLICNLLHYPVSKKQMDLSQWPVAISRQLVSPTADIIAEHDGFQIALFKLNESANVKNTERAIAEQLLKNNSGWRGMLMTVLPGNTEWHFINTKIINNDTSKIQLRRLTAKTDEKLNIVVRRLAKIDFNFHGNKATSSLLQELHEEIFTVHGELNSFFVKYKEIFNTVKNSIKGFTASDSLQRHQFSQILMNRLMFIAFVEKKGWMKINDSAHYLTELWLDYQQNRQLKGNFYRERLIPVFFEGLNMPMENRPDNTKLIGNVPYLNGGLFARTEWDSNSRINVPDNSISDILFKLFADYDFTISESTDFDMDVAVDPEMLGHVFEELMNEEESSDILQEEVKISKRKETGAYYTPRPVVDYMCREGIKHFLKMRVPKEDPLGIDDLVDNHDSSGLTCWIPIISAINDIKVCDPACGSGAYLLGMLHELLALRKCLLNKDAMSPQSEYNSKLEIIQTNIYGVDLNPTAVNIARLRLWLSLAVEYNGDTPPPLPNLDYKIEQGNSLTSLGPRTVTGQLTLQGISISDFQELKRRYADPYYDGDRHQLLTDIEQTRKEIKQWAAEPVKKKKKSKEKDEAVPFDWFVEFIEIFTPNSTNMTGGFDIVIANPPFVKAGTYSDDIAAMQRNFQDLYDGTADLYIYFYYRAIQLLRDNGVLVFISSNKWTKAGYGKKLRTELLDKTRIHTVIDFGSLPVFKNINAYPMILVAQKGKGKSKPVAVNVKSLEDPYPDIQKIVNENGFEISDKALSPLHWLLLDTKTEDIISTMKKSPHTLRSYLGGAKLPIYSGMNTGLTDAFIMNSSKKNELCEIDPRTIERLKPIAQGKDIAKWRVKDNGRWFVHTPNKSGMASLGEEPINIDNYPALRDYLLTFKSRLEQRSDPVDEWWQLRSCSYYPVFAGPKILYQEIATYQGFAFDEDGIFTNNKVFMIPTSDLYLLGVLNSKWVWTYLQAHCTSLNGGALELRTPIMEHLPIPIPTDADRAAITALVRKCLDAHGENCGEWEAEIDERVARLYGVEIV